MLMTWKRLQLEDNVLPHSHQEGAPEEDNVLPHSHQEGAPEGVDVGVKNWHLKIRATATTTTTTTTQSNE